MSEKEVTNHIGTTIPPLGKPVLGPHLPALKICPFCGSQAIVIRDGYRDFKIRCKGCTATLTGDALYTTISNWNRRAYPIREWRSAFAPSGAIQ